MYLLNAGLGNLKQTQCYNFVSQLEVACVAGGICEQASGGAGFNNLLPLHGG